MTRLPYQSSEVSVARSQDRIRTLFIRFGASHFSFSEEPAAGLFVINFVINGLPVSLPFSADNVFQAYLKEKPYTSRMKRSREAYEHSLREQAGRSVYRFAEDYLKAVFTAIEFGLLTFEEAFLGSFINQYNGQRLGAAIVPMLEKWVGGNLQLEGGK